MGSNDIAWAGLELSLQVLGSQASTTTASTWPGVLQREQLSSLWAGASCPGVHAKSECDRAEAEAQTPQVHGQKQPSMGLGHGSLSMAGV